MLDGSASRSIEAFVGEHVFDGAFVACPCVFEPSRCSLPTTIEGLERIGVSCTVELARGETFNMVDTRFHLAVPQRRSTDVALTLIPEELFVDPSVLRPR